MYLPVFTKPKNLKSSGDMRQNCDLKNRLQIRIAFIQYGPRTDPDSDRAFTLMRISILVLFKIPYKVGFYLIERYVTSL